MKIRGGRRLFGVALGIALLAAPGVSNACAVCMGDPTSKQAGAINAAIFLMLGFIGAMLASLAAFGVYLMKRSNSPGLSNPGPTDDDVNG